MTDDVAETVARMRMVRTYIRAGNLTSALSEIDDLLERLTRAGDAPSPPDDVTEILARAYRLNQEDIQTQPWVAQRLLIELAATIERLTAERAATVEAYARVIYETEPFYEGGEYVDHHMVSPGGDLSWEQAKARDAEFGDDPRMGKITEFAYKAANAILSGRRAERARLLDATADICRRIAGAPPNYWPPDMLKEMIWREAAERCEATIRAERLAIRPEEHGRNEVVETMAALTKRIQIDDGTWNIVQDWPEWATAMKALTTYRAL